MDPARQKIEPETSGSGWSMHGYIYTEATPGMKGRTFVSSGFSTEGLQFLHPQYQTAGCRKECVVLETNCYNILVFFCTDKFFRVSEVAAWQERAAKERESELASHVHSD